MRHRMAIAVLALLGVLASTYLLLYKLGIVGSLVCGGSGACERVQDSPYAQFLGIPVAVYGVGGFGVLLLVALAGLGVLFAIYLTYLEVAVIHDVCKWCVAIAVLIAAIFVVAALGARALRTAPAP
jgi:uncharacterized membrane protein